MNERDRWRLGSGEADFYRQALREAAEKTPKVKVIHPEEMPWEDSPQGRIKHMINERMDRVQTVLDLYMQEIRPGGRSGRHRHMAEECLFVLEGRGYDLHWDMELELRERYCWKAAPEAKRFEWEAGDLILVPVNTLHQHFNADPGKPARLISVVNSLYRRLGFNDLEQVEEAGG